jgi:hypothetical protein
VAEPRTPSAFVGYWRILEMEVWDRDYLDLVVPAFIEFDRERMGEFQFKDGARLDRLPVRRARWRAVGCLLLAGSERRRSGMRSRLVFHSGESPRRTPVHPWRRRLRIRRVPDGSTRAASAPRGNLDGRSSDTGIEATAAGPRHLKSSPARQAEPIRPRRE